MSNSAQFPPDQIADYCYYERVRKSGRYNMFDPRARQLTGLSKVEYAFVMENFEALQAQYTRQLEDQHILELADLHQPN